MILDGAKEHYILDIEHSDKAIEIIETLLPAIPYPKKKKGEPQKNGYILDTSYRTPQLGSLSYVFFH